MYRRILLLLLIGTFAWFDTQAQPVVRAWGNIEGIRIDGHLMAFETSIRAAGLGEGMIVETAKERQRPQFERDGNRWIVRTRLGDVELKQTVTDAGRGMSEVELEATATEDVPDARLWFVMRLPTDLAGGGSVRFLEAADDDHEVRRPVHGISMTGAATGIRVWAPHREVQVSSTDQSEFTTRDLGDGAAELLVMLADGGLEAGVPVSRRLSIEVDGQIDDRPVHVRVDASRPGRAFDGLGGNFRIQNPVDPDVIEYNLDNLRLAWGRVEMPWRFWHPDEDVDPIEAARSGALHPRVREAMEMAQELDRRGIPVMIAAWSGPDWAIEHEYAPGDQPYGLRGNRLDQTKAERIYESIADYVAYLREAYGVETVAFSFNESDLGINIRQTPEEHARLIRELGAHFQRRALPTKLLLGDTADANGYAFTYEAVHDRATHPFIHAASFHSWRGWADETLKKWGELASMVDRPLIVGEGSIDAAAWGYPQIFEELSYALEEIDLYVRILALSQPQSILQWQFTADYSVLSGGGVFGNHDEPLHPTQRFFNLQQLSRTPPSLAALPTMSDRPDVTAAALGDESRGEWAVHLVNSGASREAVVEGVPASIGELVVYVTDENRQMEEMGRARVEDGVIRVMMSATSFVSVMTAK